MWCTSARLFRRVTLVEPWMDTAATDGSAKRSRVDRLKQRRLRRDSDALTQIAANVVNVGSFNPFRSTEK